MRLRGWHVEGFGLLHDFRVDGLPDGLTVVLGPNEAGKTSLLAFIRRALFGYPDRRKKDRQYAPLRGGRHGGRLFVESDGSTWTVERFASPAHLSITQPDGSLGTEADLRRLLGGMDAELHRNVFAFSLSELQEFESLEVEGVKDRIFAAGVVGAGRSARTAIDTFAGEQAEIGRKRGDCRINNLRKRVDELDEALGLAKARAARHPEHRRAAEAADDEQKGIGEGLADARREMERLDVLLSAWPDWDERAQAELELATIAATPDLPDDFGARLESSIVAARTQRERHEERQQTAVDLEQQLAALVPDDRLAAVSAEVRRLAAQIGTMRARRERLGEIQTQRDTLHKRVEAEAPRLGPGWTSRSVREFDTSIPAAQEIAEWGERLHAVEQAVRDAGERAERLGSSAQALAAETSGRTEALKGAPPLLDAQHLSERDAAVRWMRAKLIELVALRANLAAGNERVAGAEHRMIEARAVAEAKHAEFEQRGTALRNASELPPPEDLVRRERAVRELRTVLVELGTARSDLRAANQRALDAKQRADDAELSALAEENEVECRSTALAEERPLPDAESLAARERAARELRSRLIELAALRSDFRLAETRLVDRRRDAERRATPATPSSHRRSLFIVAIVLCGLVLALVLMSQFVAAGVALGTAIVAAILAVRLPVASSTIPDEAVLGVAEAERVVQDLVTQIQTRESAAQPLATRLGCSSLPDQVELEARADEVAAQLRARQDRDRESVAVGQLRAAGQRAREVAQRLRTTAISVQADVDNVALQRVQVPEAANLMIATSLGFAGLPTIAGLEETAAELRDLAQKRRDRDIEVSAVHALKREAGHTRELAGRIEKEFSELKDDVAATHAMRVRAAAESALAIAGSLGLSAIPEPAELEVKAREVDECIRAKQELDNDAAALEELRRRTVQAEALTSKAADTADGCRRDREALRAGWSEWKAAHRCPEALRPETAQRFFASVERLREDLARLDVMEAETANVSAEIREFSQTVHPLAGQAGVPHPPEASLAEDVIEDLRERIEADAQLRTDRTRASRAVETARSGLAICERDVVAATNALASIQEEAGASDEHECRARMATSRQRADSKQRVRGAEHRLRSRLGVGERADAVQAKLASGDRQGWEARKHECKGTLARLQPEHEEALRRHQTAVETLSALERECDVVTLATEREGIVAEIRDAVFEWRRLAIAQSLVQGTLRRYELERQPAVLTRAAASFSRITDGRYTRLVTRENGIDVIAADGVRLDAAALSRGTAEQLYLCLRLALAAEFGRLAVPLPLVMDDVLVNFDPERARLAAQVLLDATPDHQVLLFTCHPETVDLLIGLAPSIKVVEIHRQTPVVRPLETRAPVVGVDRAAYASPHGLDLAEAVVSSIRTAGRPLSRAEILASTGMADAHWTAVIQELRGRGLIISHGRKRGTTWGLAEWTSLAPDED